MDNSLRLSIARFGVGAGSGWAAKWLGALVGLFPALDLLAMTSLAFLIGGSLLGWYGLAGVTFAHAAYAWLAGSPPIYILVSAIAYSAAGGAVLLAFQRASGVGRGMPNLRSFLVYAVAAAAGGLFTSSVVSIGFQPDLEVVALWARSTVVTVLVFGAPLLILGLHLPRPLLLPIPGEVMALKRQGFVIAGSEALGNLPTVTRRGGPRRSRTILGVTAAFSAIAFLSIATRESLSASNVWLGLFYFLPIMWAARRHRLRGGLLSAAGAGLALLLTDSLGATGATHSIDHTSSELSSYAYLLVFLAVGVIVGSGWDRETDLLEQLYESNKRLRHDLERVVRALSGAVEAKDNYTEGHLQRVSAFAIAVGKKLGLGERDLDMLRIASALHDVGKIGIPEQILNKPGPLDEAERRIMERHPEIGARILSNVEGLGHAAPVVLHHQERWDGEQKGLYRGYPHGLRGDEIPLGARIIAVVDAFDAMTSDRTYRAARPMSEARRVLEEEAGHQFDPTVVTAFLDLLREQPWEAEPT